VFVALPVGGCSDESVGAGGNGGTGGTAGNEFPCTEQGIRDAIAEGAGPHTFSCNGPTIAMTAAEIVVDNDVILDGEGNLTVDGNDQHRVFSVAEGVTAALRGLTVTGGSAGPGPKTIRTGAGISNHGMLALTDSTVSGNTIGWGSGGGIWNDGTLILMRTTVSENSVTAPGAAGGGIANTGRLALTDSTVSGNTSWLVDACDGTGIANRGTLTITNSTVAGAASPPCVIFNGDFAMLTITNSVLDGDCGGDTIRSYGYNIESPGDTCGFAQQTDQVNVSADHLMLGRLQDNGGPTETRALLPGSVAIDKVPAADCVDVDGEPLTTDQRGFPRDSLCDLGAFEVQP